jgi:hypothetical protein
MRKEYTISGIKYYQQSLVIGQLSRLMAEMQGIRIAEITPMGLIMAVGDRLPRLMACVLIPDGATAREVNIDRLAEELFGADLDAALEVVADFLAMADLGSRLQQITAMMHPRPKTEALTTPPPSA